MPPELEADENHSHGFFTLNRHPRLLSRIIWTISAVIALLSARYLLVEANYHYPAALYATQIATTAVVVCIHHALVCKDTPSKSWGSLAQPGAVLSIGAMCCAAFSMMCMLQALLHYKNLKTLVMLTPMMYLPEECMSLAFDAVKCTQGAGLRLYLRMGRIALLMLACIVVLLVEYRLKVTAQKSSIWTMVSLGVARALRRIALQHDPDNVPKQREERYWFLGAASIFGGLWMLTTNPKSRAVADLEYIPLALVLVNLISTTTALLLGRSIILPIDENSLETDAEQSHVAHQRLHEGTVLMIVSTVANFSLALSIRRSYTSWPQYCSFAIAILCASFRPWCDSSDWQVRQPSDRTTAYELLENEVTEDAPQSNEQQYTHTTTSGKHSWSISELILVSLLWAGSVLVNFCAPGSERLSARIDQSYEPPSPMEIVLSMYKEPIEDVKELLISLQSAHETGKASVTIYTKDEEADADDIKLNTGADAVIKLPNVGREGETYLYHITSRWDSLAKHTMYVQADVHFSKSFYRRLKNYFVPERTGLLNLGFFEPCNCEHCGDEFWW